MIKLNELIRDKVGLLTTKYKTNDPFKLMDALDIEFVEAPLGRLLGCYIPLWGTKCIFLNSDIEDQYMRLVVVAHELGHSLLHAEVNCSFLKKYTPFSKNTKNTYEREANIFAAELLGCSFDQITVAELPTLIELNL